MDFLRFKLMKISCVAQVTTSFVLNRHEDLRLADFARCRIDQRHGVTGIIVLHHRASLLPVAEAGLNTPLEGPNSIPNPSIAVTMGCSAPYYCHRSASVQLCGLSSLATRGP